MTYGGAGVACVMGVMSVMGVIRVNDGSTGVICVTVTVCRAP